MLMESVSDPRRANWLTLSSMSEDLCWPDEPSTSRPTWELEAEILRLTTRLMMRERELRQARSQLKAQTTKSQQQVASWRQRMEEKEEQVKELLVQKDAEMQNIVSQLLLFEAELRREQSRIEDLLTEKDLQIKSQRKEIDKLTRNLNLESAISGTKVKSSKVLEGRDSVCSSSSIEDTDKKPKEDRRPLYRTSISEDSGAVISSSDSCSSPLEDIGDVKEEDIVCHFPMDLHQIDLCTPFKDFDARELRKQKHIQPVFEDDKFGRTIKLNDISELPKQRHSHSTIFEDPHDSQLAVQKLRDGLVKIRAIQDVTNVKSLESPYDCVAPERKRSHYRPPQKMKDLKAKRNLNFHKNHQNTIGEINNQVML